MPFNYRTNLQYQGISPSIIAGASKSPFSVAGEEMNRLANAVDDRALAKKLEGAKGLADIAGLSSTTPTGQAMLGQKQNLFTALDNQRRQAELLGMQQALHPFAIQKAESEAGLAGSKEQLFGGALEDYQSEQAKFDILSQASPQTKVGTPQQALSGLVGSGMDITNMPPEAVKQAIFDTQSLGFASPERRQEGLKALDMYVAPTTKAGSSKASIVQDVANYKAILANGGTLDPSQQADYGVKKQYIESEGDVDRDIIDKNSAVVKKYHGNLLNKDSQISNEDIQSVKAYEKKIGFKPNAEANKAIKDKYNVLEAHKKADELIQSIQPEELAKGFLDRPVSWFQGILSDNVFSGLSTEAKEKRLLSVMTDSKIGNFLAKYVKSISGTAVAEKEYDRLANVLKGGSDLANIQTLKESFSTFGVDLANEFSTQLKTDLLDNTGTVLDLSKKFKDKTMDYYQAAEQRIMEQAGKPVDKITASNSIEVDGISYPSRVVGNRTQIQDLATKEWFYYNK